MITHPEKVLFPESGITKGALCAYYEAVGAVMVPLIAGRPVTMERYPAGIDRKGFIQKDVSKGFPAWLPRVEVPRRDGKREDPVHYPIVNDVRSLLWMANQNSITPHVWTSRLPDLDRPDLCVFDLDPARVDPAALATAALAVRALLDELSLPTFIKTSGSKGFHIVVPLDGEADFQTVWRFANGSAAVLVKRHPELLTQEFIKSDRQGRIFVDTGRNGQGATFAAVYAVRAQPGAPVSAPCTWQEVECQTVGPQTFTLATMPRRLAEHGDLWQGTGAERGQGMGAERGQGMGAARASLRGALSTLEQMLTDEDWKDALAAATRRPTSRKKTNPER